MPYAMERDVRRGQGQWKGCYSFRNIVCDENNISGSQNRRDGGLKMGHTYYYYVRLFHSFFDCFSLLLPPQGPLASN